MPTYEKLNILYKELINKGFNDNECSHEDSEKTKAFCNSCFVEFTWLNTPDSEHEFNESVDGDTLRQIEIIWEQYFND